MESSETQHLIRFRLYANEDRGDGKHWMVCYSTVELPIEKAREILNPLHAREISDTLLERALIDVQPADKTPSDWAPFSSQWSIVALKLKGKLGESGELEECLEEALPLHIVQELRDGGLSIVAAVPVLLEWEGIEEMEDILARRFEDSFYEVMDSASQSPPQDERPTLEQLIQETWQEGDTNEIGPPVRREIARVTPDGPHERRLMCDILLDVLGDDGSIVENYKNEPPTSGLTVAMQNLEAWGLAYVSGGPQDNFVYEAGRQFLRLQGRVPMDTLRFMPGHIDNLYAREALRLGGHVLLDVLEAGYRDGRLEEVVKEILPPAFHGVVDAGMAIKFVSSASALMARLAHGSPAGCLAEEILAVELIELAEGFLDMWEEEIGGGEATSAKDELRGVFELFQDDDVLDLFRMKEPGDAAVSGQSPVNYQLGVADQRPEAWFMPFGGVISTGNVDESKAFDWPKGSW